LGNEMIEQLWNQYSPLQLPYETQYKLAFGVSLSVFLLAAFIRETVSSSGLRWMARVAGAAAFFAIAGYAKYMTDENKELSYELQARGMKDATSIADQTRVVAVASEFSHEIAGTKISLTKYSNGLYGPLSLGAGSGKRISDRRSGKTGSAASSSRTFDGAIGAAGNVQDGESGRRF